MMAVMFRESLVGRTAAPAAPWLKAFGPVALMAARAGGIGQQPMNDGRAAEECAAEANEDHHDPIHDKEPA